MASTIKVNNIQNQCGANIANKCGTTITLGASGDTITLACGASQTGFGRTGTVDWDTTAKTASFTAVSGTGYFVNTTSGTVTVTLPATPSAGDIVAISDYAGTSATNNITIARNGSNIEGLAENAVINSTREARTYVYVDGTQGWVPVNTNDSTTIPPAYITATGGTITCCGDYKIHTFTGPGTFTVTCAGNPLGSNTVDYLVVAGGGGASGGTANYAAGSGAGGFRESSGAASGCYTASPLGACVSALPVSSTSYPITVGAGGAGVCCETTPGNNGSPSIFSTITSAGGGWGAPGNPAPTGGPGGSGGGGAPIAGTGNTPPVSPPQGNPGGTQAGAPPNFGRGGGGGATAAGANGTPTSGGNGGNGATTSISASPTTYAGGGGGGVFEGGTGGTGGTGGGGNGANGSPPSTAQAGTANTGGGAGGQSLFPGITPSGCGQNGGSGIVIIRYKYQ